VEQKDYILREIEKIGMIISLIRQKLFGGTKNQSVTVEMQLKDLKEMLLSGINFDLDEFMSLNIEDSNNYLFGFKGFSVENIEYLAESISEISLGENVSASKKYLEKALQLFELCNLKSKTYSLKRETNIETIKSLLF
jgi:hypothetical protein